VLRETTSRGLCGLVYPSRSSERGGEGDCVKEGAAVPWICYRDPFGDAGRHGESVILWETCWGCDVENRQARKSRGLPAPIWLLFLQEQRKDIILHPVLSANVFQISFVLEIPDLDPAGRCDPCGRIFLARVGDHLETFCLP
jgi:hypothetical protein